MRKLIMLVLLVAAVALGWVLRDRWTQPERDVAADSAAAAEVWEPLTPEGAVRARETVERLGERRSAVFANLRPGDLASLLQEELIGQLPPSAEDVRAAAIGDRLYVRAVVQLSELGGRTILGPLAGMISDRDTVQLGGRFEIVRPGLAAFRVQEIRLRDFPVPSRAIPRLIAELRRRPVPDGLPDDALPFRVPEHIGDVRIGTGRVTLYKNVS